MAATSLIMATFTFKQFCPCLPQLTGDKDNLIKLVLKYKKLGCAVDQSVYQAVCVSYVFFLSSFWAVTGFVCFLGNDKLIGQIFVSY